MRWGAGSSRGLGAGEVGWGRLSGASFRLAGPQAAHRPLQHLANRLSPCSEDSFVVQDYAQLDHIQVQKMEPSEASLPGGGNRSSFVPYAFQLTLLHNSEGRQGKILLSSDSA